MSRRLRDILYMGIAVHEAVVQVVCGTMTLVSGSSPYAVAEDLLCHRDTYPTQGACCSSSSL